MQDTVTTEPSFREILASSYTRQLDAAEALLKAIREFRSASEHEDHVFASWMRFDRHPITRKRLVHGNVVKAAERRTAKADHAAHDAYYYFRLFCDEKYRDIFDAAYGFDIMSDEALEAAKKIVEMLAAKVEEIRS